VSFPGGRFETDDHTLVNTALRETFEEIGIHPQQVEIFGHMGHYQTVSRYKVTPYIGFVDSNYQLNIDHNEVEDVFEVPWRFLLERQSHHPIMVKRQGTNHKVHFMPFKNKMIWGTTAQIIHDLIAHFE
jgi:8-oxo-dGTP pyrophosphatase MutT (NUDIX family)